MEPWRHGDLESWTMESWRLGVMETGNHRDIESWRLGVIAACNHVVMDISQAGAGLIQPANTREDQKRGCTL